MKERRKVVSVTYEVFYPFSDGTWQYMITVKFNYGPDWLEGKAIAASSREDALDRVRMRAGQVGREQAWRVGSER